MIPCHISGNAALAGVIGYPVAHSLSPCLHNFWLNTLGIDGAYIPLNVHPDSFETVLRHLPDIGFKGVNITVPFKERAFQIADQTDPLANQVGAVNTIDILPNGSLYGRNTDIFGFEQNIIKSNSTFDTTKGPAFVLGAGGACRGVMIGLKRLGVPEIWLSNRTRDKADNLADMIRHTVNCPIRVFDWDKAPQRMNEVNIIVNTTSLGMKGQPPLDFDLKDLAPSALVTDIVYTPLETDILAHAKVRGNPIIDGLNMLLYQAQPGFYSWFGHWPPVNHHIRSVLLSQL